jgi:uncharacterized RDD family membrane protein YckC
MRTIDILTTQNVTINYELAGAKDRVFATIIDIIVQSVAFLLLSLILLRTGLIGDSVFAYIFVYPILFFYHLGFEVFMDGQTPGKRIIGIKVVKLTGTEPSLNDYIVRWAMRPIDIFFSLGSIALMMVNSSEKSQRLGDLVANTTVVKIVPSQKIMLSDIMNIRTLNNHIPTYPEVRGFSEQEMLLLKEVMDRNIKHRNASHEIAMEHACQAVKKRLNLEKIPADRNSFIRTLIKDYVALSR